MSTQPDSSLQGSHTPPLDVNAFYELAESGVLRISGKDCLGFIQRQTTNDVQKIHREGAIHTVLTSPTGRILDILLVIALKDEVLTITLPSRHLPTIRFLKSRIFFMDKVEIRDDSPLFTQFFVIGNRVAEIPTRFGMSGTTFEPVIKINWEGSELIAIHQKGKLGEGLRLLIPREITARAREILLSSGAKLYSSPEYQLYRIEAGIPGAQAELTEDYTPLEVDLKELVAENKGCYTGQEILARQLNYQKVTRQLAGLQFTGEIETGSKLYSGAKPAGELTSFVHSPRFGPIGLALVKSTYNQPGAKLTARLADREVMGTIKSLPFS